ncbi:MAG TPA: carboxylating nicotinate-nucleotide diphosphorylase [Candidatus Latescibacteria bacterium]|nr:carboxylating nicotinate-nucleotide diphosphorylase [Candidatus Latescibacterota bacterium]
MLKGPKLDEEEIRRIVRQALEEDVGAGDITSLWTVDEDKWASGTIFANEKGIVAGIEVARVVFEAVDKRTRFEARIADGEAVKAKTAVARITGPARAILTAERTALNFLQRMSGIATLTAKYVEAVKGTKARILDTRKTTPGLRALEKYAVRKGGGQNHRFGLYDMVLIKENHIRAAGGIVQAIAKARQASEAQKGRALLAVRENIKIEVEVRSPEEVRQALSAGADRIMLDNMEEEQIRKAVDVIRSSGEDIEIEASGGIKLENVRQIAETGVDFISVGALTHSAPALDMSLLMEETDPSDVMVEEQILSGLKTRAFGRKVYCYGQIRSTQEVAIRLASAGTEEGTLVVAEKQTHGRGRLGRTWESSEGHGIYASLILRPRISPSEAWRITACAALSIAKAIRQGTGLEVRLKWPNDLLINTRKVCGVLTDVTTESNRVKSLILGFGINVNQTREDFSEDLRETATSLYIETGNRYSRIRLLQDILETIERNYAPLRNGTPCSVTT